MPTQPQIVSVLLPQPLPEPFDYELPEGLSASPGSFVSVPLGPREMIGVIWAERGIPSNRKLKPVQSVLEAPPLSPNMRSFIERAAKYICAPMGNVLAMAMRSREALEEAPIETLVISTGASPDRMTPAREKVLAHATSPLSAAELARLAGVSSGVVKGLVEQGALAQVERSLDPPFPVPDPNRPSRDLTGEQAETSTYLRGMVKEKSFRVALLDGVTGSGKTEVYFEAIAEALQDPEAQVLVLLPEIALTQAVTSRFEERFGAIPAEWHSAAGSAARRRVWREVAAGRARIVVGARSALFLPFRKLRLIVVDEEHDQSYKQDEGVNYHARDLAVLRASIEPCSVVLASATPSLETLQNAQAGRYVHLRLHARPGMSRLPDIAIADMRASPPEANRWIGPQLAEAIEQTLAAKEQALLFLNRRGYAPLVICRACGERLKAPDTDSWLVEHRYTGRLVCHLTGFTMDKPLALSALRRAGLAHRRRSRCRAAGGRSSHALPRRARRSAVVRHCRIARRPAQPDRAHGNRRDRHSHRHADRRQGPQLPDAHAGRRRRCGCRPAWRRPSRGRAYLPAAAAGCGQGGSRGQAGSRHHPDLCAGEPRHRTCWPPAIAMLSLRTSWTSAGSSACRPSAVSAR